MCPSLGQSLLQARRRWCSGQQAGLKVRDRHPESESNATWGAAKGAGRALRSGSSCDGGGGRAARSGWGPQRRRRWFSGHLVAEVSQQPVQSINAEKRERIKLKKLEVKEML